MGSHQNLSTDLEEAMEFSETSSEEQTSVPILEARLKGRALPEFVASNPLIPNMDAERVRQELQQGDDGLSIKVETIPAGIKLSVDFEEGFVRLIGRDWIRQIEAFHQ
jgi:hypothetical protein